MSPVSNPLKAAASTSTEHESGSAKKSRLNDDFIEVKRESLSPTIKSEIEYDYPEEKKYDVKTNEIADSTHMKHLDVGISTKPKSTFLVEPNKPVKAGSYEKETDPMVLTRREKQIDYGKNTPEYANYLAAVPKDKRENFHPKTPNKYRKYSRRAWDGLIRQWRLNLHCWSDLPLEDLESLNQIKREHNDSFCSEDTNVSASTSSSVAAAFTVGLGIHSSQEDLKSISRSGSVSFPDYEEDVDVKPDIKDVLRVNSEDEMNVTLKNDEVNEALMMPQTDGPLRSFTSKVKLESSDMGNTSWADEAEEELWTDGEPTP